MSFWDGTQWVPEPGPLASPAPAHRARPSGRLATLLVLGLMLALPLQGVFAASPKGSIQVVFGTSSLAPLTSADGSIFTSYGCGFRANSADYYMVVRGPAPDTTSLAYWVDPFAVGAAGCGSSTVSWTSSGVAGNFDVWIVRSPSGNPWQAPAASNVVTITITNP